VQGDYPVDQPTAIQVHYTQTDPHVLAACAYPSNLSTVIDCVILCL